MKPDQQIGIIVDIVINREEDTEENWREIQNCKNVFKIDQDAREHVKTCCRVCFPVKRSTGMPAGQFVRAC